MTDASPKDHWDNIYRTGELKKLGWYEERPEQSLRLVMKCDLGQDDPIIDIGAGETTLIEHLLRIGFRQVTAVDISEVALTKLRQRLGKEKAAYVQWIVDDITCPVKLSHLKNMALWHDRAVLHFLLEEEERSAYFTTLRSIVRPGGYAIIAAFSLKGVTMCSGLKVKNYDQYMLADLLGPAFVLLEWFDYVHYNPSGAPRPYIYTLFRRNE